MALSAVIGGAQGGLGGVNFLQLGVDALAGMLVVFGAWALGRELVRDHDWIAFVCMAALAFVVFLVVDSPSLVLLFATLFLVWIVNRTVGLPARLTNSIAVLLFIAWAASSTQNTLVIVVGALAFLFEALLHEARRHQFVFATLCVAVSAAWILTEGFRFQEPTALAMPLNSMMIVVGIGLGIAILRTPQCAVLVT